MSELFEPGQRFKGCPPICVEKNLPSFESEAAAREWHAAPGKGNPLYEPSRIRHIGKCQACGMWHFLTKARPPSGASSGGGR